MPDLAVIMSVYHRDRPEFVRQSVQSILDQTFRDFHYYLIFDGPVRKEVEKFIGSLTDDRIRVYKLEKNGGLAAALNYLLELVLKNKDYKFIARMDADDVSMPERFEKQRKYLIENPEITVLGSWYEEIDESGKHLSYRKLPTNHEALRKRYYTRTPFAHSSVLYRRELIEKAGFYPTDTVLMEDNVLWGRGLSKGHKFANLPEYLFKFRIDTEFYKRRSGIKYGWEYIKSRFYLNNIMRAPFYAYIFSFGIGAVKMFPIYLIRLFYHASRNNFHSH